MERLKIISENAIQSKYIQFILFELGARWASPPHTDLRWRNKRFLYVETNGTITCSDTTQSFNRHGGRQVNLEHLKQMLKQKRMKQKNQDSRRPVQITKEQAQQMIESDCEISKQIALDTYPELRLPQLPKRWEDIDLMENTCYVDQDNRIKHMDRAIVSSSNKNLLPNTNVAEAHRVVPELITMREIYRDGWKPSKCDRGWSVYYSTDIEKWVIGLTCNNIFCFPTEEVARMFLDNFEPQLKTYAKLYK